MGLTHRPDFRLLANGDDVTATIRARLRSLRYTDEAGLDADVLEVVLADHDPERPIQIPPSGAELDLALGFDGQMQRVGLFVVDELELSGPPGEMTIRARAAPFDGSRGGMSRLQTQKRRAWPGGTRLADIVRTVAAEHRLRPIVAASLEGVRLPHQDQLDESDLSFLVRVARRYDAVVKPAGGRLVLAKRGESRSASGAALPEIALAPADVSTWRVSITQREQPGTVVACWHATKQARRHEVKLGAGEPVTRLRRYYPSADMAQAAARAELDRRARRQATLSLALPGRVDLSAEGRVVLSGFRAGVDGVWLVRRAEHALDSAGLVTSIEAERPGG